MMLDVPLIWAGIIGIAVAMYVILDGFDLGIGILFPFAIGPEPNTLMRARSRPRPPRFLSTTRASGRCG